MLWYCEIIDERISIQIGTQGMKIIIKAECGSIGRYCIHIVWVTQITWDLQRMILFTVINQGMQTNGWTSVDIKRLIK